MLHTAQGSSLGQGVHSEKQRKQVGHTLGSFKGLTRANSIAVGPLSSTVDTNLVCRDCMSELARTDCLLLAWRHAVSC